MNVITERKIHRTVAGVITDIGSLINQGLINNIAA